MLDLYILIGILVGVSVITLITASIIESIKSKISKEATQVNLKDYEKRLEIKEYVNYRKQELKEIVANLQVKPTLAIVKVGNNEASERYVRNKVKDCEEVGIKASVIQLSDIVQPENDFYAVLDELNNSAFTGYIVQLPLPAWINPAEVAKRINYKKDADGFNVLSNAVGIMPATPTGIINYLEACNYDLSGKNAVVIGRSDIVGKPMAQMLLNKDMNVTVLHSRTQESDKKQYIENADYIIVATGHRHTLTNDYKYKPNAVVIDVGINFDENGKLCGDCDKGLPVDYQSPVPGGVGLLTRLALIENLLKLTSLYDTVNDTLK